MNFLPSDHQDFKQLRENNNIFYVDKSYFIKEWWESSYDKVSIILRPRCFGKTLNMSMIDYFFSIRYDNVRYLFQNLFISKENEIMQQQGQFPVILLNFGDIKVDNCESMKNQIKMKIWHAYMSYKKVMMESEKLDKSEKVFIDSITSQIGDDVAIHSIQNLCYFLNKIYEDRGSIVILDGYDSMITNKMNFFSTNDAWESIKDFYISFIMSTFKDNKFMMRGLITGIINIPLSFSIGFSSNFNVYNMTSNKYSNCFGFNNDEMKLISNAFHCSDIDADEIERWYGGYKFGDIEIFNPFSIIQFFNEKSRFSFFWPNIMSNDFFIELLRNSSLNIIDCLIELIQGQSVQKELNEKLVFYNSCLQKEEECWNLLLSFGFLKLQRKEILNYCSKMLCTLELQNEEVTMFLIGLINRLFEFAKSYFNDFMEALLRLDVTKMANCFNSFVIESFPFFVNSQNQPEIVYHAFILGLSVHIRNSFYISIYDQSKNSGFYFILKPIEIDISFIISFYKENCHELDHNECFPIINVLRNEGFDSSNIKMFIFSFINKECTIKCLEENDFPKDDNYSSNTIDSNTNESDFVADINANTSRNNENYNELNNGDNSLVDKELNNNNNNSMITSELSNYNNNNSSMITSELSNYNNNNNSMINNDLNNNNNNNNSSMINNDLNNNNNNNNSNMINNDLNSNNNNSMITSELNNNDDIINVNNNSEVSNIDDDGTKDLNESVNNSDINDENEKFPPAKEGYPKFDYSMSKKQFHVNDHVYVIDENEYDIFEGVIIFIGEPGKYLIHYPKFPEDDELISDRYRILEKTKNNRKIYETQEKIRNAKISKK